VIWNRRHQPTLTPEQRLHQEALNHLVALHPGDYIQYAMERVNEIPNGGSRLPWRYRRQFLDALDTAEHDLIAAHPARWNAILDVLRLRHATPEDIIGNDTP